MSESDEIMTHHGIIGNLGSEHPHPSFTSPQVCVHDACFHDSCVHVFDVESLLFLLFFACCSRSQCGVSSSCFVVCPFMFAPFSLSLFFSSFACCFFVLRAVPHLVSLPHFFFVAFHVFFFSAAIPLPCRLCLPPCLCEFIRLFFFHPPPQSSFPLLFVIRVSFSFVVCISYICVLS